MCFKIYEIAFKLDFQRLISDYDAILESMRECRPDHGINKYVTKRKCSNATEATVAMGRSLDMFHHVRMMTSVHAFSTPKTKHVATMSHDEMTVKLNGAIESLRRCYLLRTKRHCLAQSAHGKYLGSGNSKSNDSSANKTASMVMGCYDVIPMFSLIAYIIVGSENSLLDDYHNNNNNNNNNNICMESLTFNWIVISLFIIHNLVLTLPICYRAVTGK